MGPRPWAPPRKEGSQSWAASGLTRKPQVVNGLGWLRPPVGRSDGGGHRLHDWGDPTELPLLNWPAVGRILFERQVSARSVVVREVASQGTAQVLFAKDDDVIQTLAPDGADEPLREGVLPWAVGRRQDFADGPALEALPEHVTVDRVAVSEGGKTGRSRPGRRPRSAGSSRPRWDAR